MTLTSIYAYKNKVEFDMNVRCNEFLKCVVESIFG